MQLKENCWRYDTETGAFFVKYYEDSFAANKVRFIHEQLTKQKFPYIAPMTSKRATPYIVHKWIEGKPASYEKREDRTKTLAMLQALHEATIGWEGPYLPRQDLRRKWEARLSKFISKERELTPLLGANFHTIVSLGELALKKMKTPKDTTHSLLHGDVVHHNFLLGETPVLIDFDLACLGDPSEEVILWMHRVLPHMQYDVKALLYEQPYAENVRHKLAYLIYPNELLREWLYLLQISESQKEHLLKYVNPFTERSLFMWSRIMKHVHELS
ncbi:phosphotransferase [Lysinibacillus sp. 3P01SB]|uniref:phosphotransferase n=1 Tax=Lysinibacillus sp. 3P01SB TaxID=3132284 RepID=UPI0039A5A033